MTDDTIVGVYDTGARAEAAVADLRIAGVPESAITVQTSATGSAATSAPVRETGFWASLFGGEPGHDTAVYDRSMQGGAAVVTVRVQGGRIAQVMEIMDSHHPVDLEDRATGYGLGTSASSAGTANAAGGTLQLAEEQLNVGKRVVNRGGTRIRRYVVETPVAQDVTLHSERVTLERRPVADGRPVTDSFSEKTLALTETAEEAVVAKTARVYEEVGLRKEATERVETIRDTVRKEEVEVESIPAGSTATTTATSATTLPHAPRI